MAPKIKEEELWTDEKFPLMIIVSTNSAISKSGALIMGKGAARQMRDRINGIDKRAAEVIAKARIPKHYGFLALREATENVLGLGIFQTKAHYKDDADLRLIAVAAADLRRYALTNRHTAYRMNFPGIGEGNLSEAEVLPLLSILPPNITICKYSL